MKSNIEIVTKLLDELSYGDWLKIKTSVDYAFDLKRKELERNLKLNSNEIKKVIHSRFG